MLAIVIAVVVLGVVAAMAALYTGLDRSQKARRDQASPKEDQFLRDEGTVGEVIEESVTD